MISSRGTSGSNAAFGGTDKFRKTGRILAPDGIEFFQNGRKSQPLSIEQAEQSLDCKAPFLIISIPLETDRIDTHDPGRNTLDRAKRRNILTDETRCSDHGKTADMCMLMNGYIAGNKCPVTDDDMPCQKRGIRHGDVIAYYSVMPDMAAGHHVDMMAYIGCPAIMGTAVHRHTFPENRILADLESGMHCDLIIRKILWQTAESGKGVYNTPLPKSRVTANPGMSHDPAIPANSHRPFQHSVRANLNTFIDLC